MSRNKKSYHPSATLCFRIMLIVYILVVATCWFFAWLTMKSSHERLIKSMFESATSDQYYFGESIKTYTENLNLSVNDKYYTLTDQIKDTIKDYTRFHIDDKGTYRITDADGSLVSFNMSQKNTAAINLSPPNNGTQYYYLGKVNNRSVVFVSSYIRVYSLPYKIDCAKDITNVITEEVNLARHISRLLFVLTSILLLQRENVGIYICQTTK